MHDAHPGPSPIQVISYGGGVQSTALLALAAEGRIPERTFLFANVGDDSEHPATLDYVQAVAMPYAREHGIDLRELYRVDDDGTPRTLMRQLANENTPSIPVFLQGQSMPTQRSCTRTFKLAVVDRWLKEAGATKENPARVGLGISTDEISRVSNKAYSKRQTPYYPLIDLHLSRLDCDNIIRRAGLPVPPKSACFFCPFHRVGQWREMRRDEPELFERAAELEETLNVKRRERGKDDVFLTRYGVPLREAISAEQDMLPGFGPEIDTCDEGGVLGMSVERQAFAALLALPCALLILVACAAAAWLGLI